MTAVWRRPIRVLVIDDSAVVRVALRELLDAEPDIEVIATAIDPYQAVEEIRVAVPDVVTLDLEMPRMDGLTFLRKLMRQHPLPVVVCSSLTAPEADETIRAFELGAVEVIHKPTLGSAGQRREAGILIADSVRAAAAAAPHIRRARADAQAPGPWPDTPPPRQPMAVAGPWQRHLVVAGVSTGGPDALGSFLPGLPTDGPPVVVVQHMPAAFTAQLARRLDRLTALRVEEARNGQGLVPGAVYIAPGGQHAMIRADDGGDAGYRLKIETGPLVNRHRPSVDVLFRSAARHAGNDVVGVIMTGMGADGAEGLRELHEAGAATLAQDEASCVVYGMPKAAIERGAVDQVLPLADLAAEVIAATRRAPTATTAGSALRR